MNIKYLILVFVFLISLFSVNALPKIIDKTDLSNLSSPQEYQSWDWSNITLLVDHLHNVTRIGYNWSCSYRGEGAIPACWTQTGTPSVSTTTPFALGNKLFFDGTDALAYNAGSLSWYFVAIYRQQLSSGNFYTELDNGACTNRFLGVAKEDVNNRGSRTNNCASYGTLAPSQNQSAYVAITIDGNETMAYVGNGTDILTIEDNAGVTNGYIKVNFELTGGTSGAIGRALVYNQLADVQNSSANRWQKKIRLSAPNATFNLSVLKIQGDGNFTLFISGNNGTNWSTTTINSSLIDIGQLSQDIIYGYNLSMRTNISNIQLRSVDEAQASDTTSPIVNTSFNSSTPNNLMSVFNFSANITDETGLLSANWTINLSTGTLKINNTLSGTSAQVSNTTSFIGLIGGSVINFSIIVTDTNNNIKQNSTVFTLADLVIPRLNISTNNSAPKINEIINISANISDDTGLSFCQFIDNSSGLRYFNKSITGTNDKCSQNYTLSLSRGNVINFTVMVNDTSNNLNQSSTIVTIANTPHSAITFANTTGTKTRKNETLNYSSSDADLELLNYTVYFSQCPVSSLEFFYTTDLNFTTNMTSDATYCLNVSVTDGIEIINSTTSFNITLDATAPNATLLSPINNSFVTLSTITEIIQFSFNVAENSTCTLYFDNSRIANSTDTNNNVIYNATVASFGIGEWFVNCSDTTGNKFQSPFFFIDVRQGQQTGGGPAPSSPGGGTGGGISTPSSSEVKYTYTLTYICNRTREFIQNHTIKGIYAGYSSEDLVKYKSRITNELGYSISDRTLKEYIDNSESYCGIKKVKSASNKDLNIDPINITQFLSVTEFNNIELDNNILNITLHSYIPLFSDGISIGSIKYYEDKNAKGLINLLNLFFRISPSDPYTDNPNFLLFGPRLLPLALIGISSYGFVRYKRYKKNKKPAN